MPWVGWVLNLGCAWVCVKLPEVEFCLYFLTLSLMSSCLWAFVSLIIKGNNTKNTYFIGSFMSMVLKIVKTGTW